MKPKIIICIFYFYFWNTNVIALNLPGPKVYVVTASPRPFRLNEGKSVPFYYHNWMRRMDTGFNITSTSTTAAPKEKTPDLIFAEFESDGSREKSIRKLIEKEKVTPKTTTLKTFLTEPTTTRPIYVPDEEGISNHDTSKRDPVVNRHEVTKTNSNMLNDYYNNASAPVYLPSTTPSTTTTKASTTTTTLGPINLENIWHIIDNEKFNHQSGSWDESALESNNEDKETNEQPDNYATPDTDSQSEDGFVNEEADEDEVKIDENFALPGIGTNPGNGAENESRAIRTEQNLRFPYINLKPFQMKKPLNVLSNSKKNNMFNSLNNFYDLKQPVRGEAQDVVSMNHAIDRYNPAQPYLPKPDYNSKVSKQSSPNISSQKAKANLVPPPPPPPPRITGDDFPSPTNYESFPPYSPSSSSFASAPASKPVPPPSRPNPPSMIPPSITGDDFPSPSNYDSFPPYPPTSSFASAPAPKPVSPQPTSVMSVPSIETSIDTDSPESSDDDNRSVMDLGYRYKPPSAPPQFVPTISPPPKQFQGYSYNKPSPSADLAPPVSKPDFQGYQYKKPEPPPPTIDQMSTFQGYQYNKPEPPMDMHDLHEYSYTKPDDHKHPVYEAPDDHGDHDSPPPNHDSDYPELIFNKHHDDDKGGENMNGHDMGMMPPAAPADAKPDMDDHGFPSDFPGDLKYHHDFEDHDHDHYHYHHPTTTTTTTEMPRVNRYSYYYLGKKLYYLPLYFSVYFIIYVAALIIKAVLRHKIVYPNSWRPNTTTASFFSKRSVDAYLSHENLHDLTGRVTHAIATAAEKYMSTKKKTK